MTKDLLKKIKGMNKEDFINFINKIFDIEGCLGGLMLNAKIDGKDVEIMLSSTNYDLYQDFKKTEEFKILQKNYSKENLEEYEKELHRNHLDFINDSYAPLRFYNETLSEINEHLLSFYDAHENELDQDLIYSSKNFIREEIEKQLKED